MGSFLPQHMLHGGDYNPDQWRHDPKIWEDDVRLMKEANVNCVSLGIFAWSALEPEEGQFDFGWMDRVVELLGEAKITINFATPGGARPAWMAQRYPEVLRVDAHGRRQLWGFRHNHCFTSPVFREKCQIINTQIAERYKDYPYHGVWHVNNEYSGECHCDLCQSAFRVWVKKRYDNSLERLNRAWWSGFWSHTITDWSQVVSPSPIGERHVHCQTLDWARFCTHQTIQCFRDEAQPLRDIMPGAPVTTNFMAEFSELDYEAIASELDVISWDNYPGYADTEADYGAAVETSFLHEQRRAMLQKPFLLMECTPSIASQRPVGKLKRPGQHKLEALQAIAHGSESVLYFQWRKGQGAWEKFHGAVVDHALGADTRVFREVAEVGAILKKLDGVVGAMPAVDVAVIYDYQNRWAIDDTAGPRNSGKNYFETCCDHYRPFWEAGVPADVIDSDHDLSKYKLVIAPMLYMIRPGVAERLEAFVRGGGTLVTTYMTGIANESDLCFQNGFPGPLRELCGIWSEETDALYDGESVPIAFNSGNDLGVQGSFAAREYCDVIHAESAQVLATYGGEFYQGTPAVTVNHIGLGRVYHIASRNDAAFLQTFTEAIINQLELRLTLGDIELPPRVTATSRAKDGREYIFVLSFNSQPIMIDLRQQIFIDVLEEREINGSLNLPAYGVAILERA